MSKSKKQYFKSPQYKSGDRSPHKKQYGKQHNTSSLVHSSACSRSSCSMNAKKLERGIIVASVFIAVLGLLASVIDVFRAMILFSAL